MKSKYPPMTMAMVRKDNPTYFSRENMGFFGDIGFSVLTGKKTGKRYLVHHTNAWSDMFTGVKIPHYRLHILTMQHGKIKVGDLLDPKFKDLEEVKDYLRQH